VIKNLSTHFGNKKIRKSQKTDLVQNLFTDVSNKYDLMNDIMSLGSHRLWKKELIELMNIQKGHKILDVGCGTGDIGIKILDAKKSNDIFLGDLNLSMIELGKKKQNLKKNNIKWINMNAEQLPFINNFFDKYVISFCLRNVTDIEKTLNESFRVLREGGEFFCMEFSKIKYPLLKKIYDSYKDKIIPHLGNIVANKFDAYNYLSESIDIFPEQEKLLKELKKIGFVNVSYHNLFGGIVSVHRGWKI